MLRVVRLLLAARCPAACKRSSLHQGAVADSFQPGGSLQQPWLHSGTRMFATEAEPLVQGNAVHSVRAYHAGCKILLQQLVLAFPSAAQQGRHHVLLQLDKLPGFSAATEQGQAPEAELPPTYTTNPIANSQDAIIQGAATAKPPLALAFRFGCVVFYPSQKALDLVVLRDIIQPFVVDPEPAVHEEDTMVEVRPTLDKWVERAWDKIIVRTLDLDNLSLIACALGQSAALDHYTWQANAALEEYHSFKLGRPSSGRWGGKGPLGHDELLKLVARNRQLRVEVIGLLGILDRSEAAWRSDKYFLTWQALTKEFELASRLDVLLDKLRYLEAEVKYELETHHDRNLEMLVNIVIVLLVLSVLVTAYHLSKGWTSRQKKHDARKLVPDHSLEHAEDVVAS